MRALHTKRAAGGGETEEEKAHHGGPNGTFKNVWEEDLFDKGAAGAAYHAFTGFILKGMFERAKLPNKEDLKKLFPLGETDWNVIQNPANNAVNVTWIGHASFLIQLGGVNILTDPVFSQRVEPLPYTGPFRYAPLPFTIEQLPKIDFVVISHSHYDHLDLGTVRRIGNGPTWYVGLGLGEWFLNEGITNVVEMDWWEERVYPGMPNVKIVCTPCKHWSMRTPFDRKKTLWCSWAVQSSQGGSFFFAGDTGLCPAFAEIGQKYGPFTVAAIPIGAYLPREFMRTHHVSPEDAVQLHVDVCAEWSVACHWGTFRQKSFEHVADPPKELKASLEKRQMRPDCFEALKHGETRVVLVKPKG